jgi:hypothetical protein
VKLRRPPRPGGSRARPNDRPRRAAAAVAALGLTLVLVACGGSTPATPSAAGLTPSPAASASPAPTLAAAGSFADLPFSLDLPDGWVFGTPQDVAATLKELAASDAADAQRLQSILDQAPTTTSVFVAYQTSSSEGIPPSLSCNTLDLGTMSAADAMTLGETQNRDAIAGLPGIVGEPVADRVSLPVGETVRIRWRSTAFGEDATSLGYQFVAGPTVFTCVFTSATTTAAMHQPEFEAILATFRALTPAASATPAGTSGSDCPTMGELVHQAPEIEALLPDVVQDRPLTRWSVRGECWLELTISDAAARAQVVASATTPANPNPIDPAQLVYGVAGRSDTSADPPYFVYAAVAPQQDDEGSLVLLLLLGGAGYHDIAAGLDPGNYEQRTIAGKPVYVGDPSMVDQTAHQQGRPYLYETSTHEFLVIADDEAWAADALAQLP